MKIIIDKKDGTKAEIRIGEYCNMEEVLKIVTISLQLDGYEYVKGLSYNADEEMDALMKEIQELNNTIDDLENRMANINQLKQKWAFMLADKAILSMTSQDIIAGCPQDYGSEVTDDHRTYVWDKLADAYMELDESELFDLYDKYIQKGKKMDIMSRHDMQYVTNKLTDILMEQLGDEQLDALLFSLNKDKKDV